jgi:iron complex outermembrane receptor protein
MRPTVALTLAGWLTLAVATAAPAQDPEPLEGLSSLDSLLSAPVSAAAKHDQTGRDAAASVSVVTGEDIGRFGYRTVADVLASVPGFYLTNDRTFTTVGVRGFGRPWDFNNRVLLLLDGHTLNSDTYGAAPIGPDMPLDLDAIDRIEVVRGPGSALYGSGAVFAVVNLVTKRGQAIDGGHLRGIAGSFGRRGVAGTIGKRYGKLDVMLSGRWEETSGQRLVFPELANPLFSNGVADHYDWDDRTGFLATAHLGGLSLLGRVTSNTAGIPTPLSAASRYHAFSASTELRYERQLSPRHNLMTRVYGRWGDTHVDFVPAPDVAVRLEDRNTARGVEVAWRWDAASFSRLTVGTEYLHRARMEQQTRMGPLDVTYVKPGSALSFYAQEQLALGRKLTLLGGVRADFDSGGSSPVAPRAAAVYHASGSTTFKLLYGEAIRVPTMTEGQSADLNPAAPLLEPERVRTFEAVWDQRLARWLQGSIAAFSSRGNNLIDQRTFDAGTTVYDNVLRATTQGFEVALQARRGDLNGYASVEVADADDGNTGAPLSNAPAHMVKLGLTHQVFGLDLGGELRGEAGRVNPRGGETGGFTVVNLTLSRAVPAVRGPLSAIDRRAEFSVQVRNVFNTKYSFPASFTHVQQSFPQDGRTLWVTAGYRF